MTRSGSSRSGRAAGPRGVSNSPLTTSSLSGLLSSPSPLSLVEDRRFWHPDPDHGMFTVGGRVARVVVHKRPIIARSNTLWSPRGLPVGIQVPVGLRVESPFKVITCIRRKVRRQIMFATGRSGKGVKKRGPRRSWRSNISC